MKTLKRVMVALMAALTVAGLVSCANVEVLPVEKDTGLIKVDAQSSLNAVNPDKPVVLAFVNETFNARMVAEVNKTYDVIKLDGDTFSIDNLSKAVYIASRSDAVAIFDATNNMANPKIGFAGTLAAKFKIPLLVTDNGKDYESYSASFTADNALTLTKNDEVEVTIKYTDRTLEGLAEYDPKAAAENILSTYDSDNLLYLSGPMTGLSDEVIHELFSNAEAAVAEKFGGSAAIVNPSAHDDPTAKCWADYLARDVYIIESTKTLFQIQNMMVGEKVLTWKTSGGSNLEYYTYTLLGGTNVITTDNL